MSSINIANSVKFWCILPHSTPTTKQNIGLDPSLITKHEVGWTNPKNKVQPNPSQSAYSTQFQYTSIFITDTGGTQCVDNQTAVRDAFFGHPTGRLSDGRLIIDFIGRFTFFFTVPIGLC